MAHPNEDVVRRGFAAFAAGDTDTMRELFAPDVAWHVAGRHPLAGSFKGVEEVLRHFGQIQERAGGTYRSEVHDIVGNDQHVFAAFIATAKRAGKSLRDGQILLCHVSDGKVTEAWLLPGDAHLVDDFWSS
jgi:uncharacterized protein